MKKKIILIIVGIILVLNFFIPQSVGQTRRYESKNMETNSGTKQIQIGHMYQKGGPGDYEFELKAIDVGDITVKKGTEVVFYCTYNFEVGGAADDVLGYINCLLGGAGRDEVKTGKPKTGRLECSKIYKQNSLISFELYLKYTDWFGTKLLREETKYSNGNLKAPTFEYNIIIEDDSSVS